MNYSHLLAKSSKDSESPRLEETLLGHILKVVESFKIIFGLSGSQPTRLAHQWLRFFKLNEDDFKTFFINGLVSCGLHDLGKGNGGFQDLVRGRRGRQTIWHEHLTGLLLNLPEMQKWLHEIPLLDSRIVIGSVISHHLRVNAKDFAQPLNPDIKCFYVFTKEILDIANRVATEIGGAQLNEATIEPVWSFDGKNGFYVGRLRDTIQKQVLRKFCLESRKDHALNRMLMAVRSALILADSSGSAIVRENKDINNWLQIAFGTLMDGEYITKNVIDPRIGEIQRNSKKTEFTWSDFQIAAEELSSRALLLAPCGSGKTLAAWRWVKRQLAKRPVGRVIFLYPTRATATEGFRDYVSWAPEADGSLITGTAAYELQGMFDNPTDERYGKDYSTEDRLYALGFWHRRVFSATVDQFLGFMQQVYRSVCLMPLLADSVIVIDEVHSFDQSLFSALKLFLKNFDVPVFCMTASLPPGRKKDLYEECGLEIFPSQISGFSDLETMAAMPRYVIRRLDGEESAKEIAAKAQEQGKRVLWVVNTVSRCQSLARSQNALCYHSRYRLQDRKKRHVAVIQAFKGKREPILAITTQVCEMSLDLDADVLISELAPIASLIQRMGRCNRHAQIRENKLGQVYLYKPEDMNPYDPKDLDGIEAFLDALEGKKANQILLEELLEKYGATNLELERFSAFLENGPWAMARDANLRDEKDLTIEAVLSDDLPLYFELRQQRNPVDGLFIPVPRKFAKEYQKLGSFPRVAMSSHYHPEYGFFDHPLEEII